MRQIDATLAPFTNGAGPQSTMTPVAVQTEEPGSDSVRWLEPVEESGA